MYTILKEAHSGWAYLVLILLVVAIVNSIIGLSNNKPFTAKDRKFGLFALIASHIQLLLALILYFTSPYFAVLKDSGMGAVMKNSELRLYLIEHPLMNIIGIVLITMAWSKHKKATDDVKKFKLFRTFYLIALVLFLSRIPWSAWLN